MVTQKQEKNDSTTEQSKIPTQQTDNTIVRTPSPLMRQKRINRSSTNLTHSQGGGGSLDSIDVVDGDETIDERKKNKREGEDEVTKLVNKPLATRCVCVSCICVSV